MFWWFTAEGICNWICVVIATVLLTITPTPHVLSHMDRLFAWWRSKGVEREGCYVCVCHPEVMNFIAGQELCIHEYFPFSLPPPFFPSFPSSFSLRPVSLPLPTFFPIPPSSPFPTPDSPFIFYHGKGLAIPRKACSMWQMPDDIPRPPPGHLQ